MQTLYRYLKLSDSAEHVGDFDSKVWHASLSTDTLRTVCGDALDADGDFEYITKTVNKGGITCGDCLRIIKDIKAIRL